MKNIAALYHHWFTADTIKQFILTPVVSESKQPIVKRQIPASALELVEHQSTFIRVCVWFALLYVVIEGYRESEQKDAAIDKLLAQSEMVDALRRFRNAIFHYQEDPYSEKFKGFIDAKESEVWIMQLNAAFQSFFERVIPMKELLAEVGVYRQDH